MRGRAIAALVLVAMTAPADAQRPRARDGGEAGWRESYLAEVKTSLGHTITALKHAFLADRIEEVVSQFAAGATFFPTRGEPLYGPQEIRPALQRRMRRYGGMTFVEKDWTASGSLAYFAGRYFYGPTHIGGEAEQGDFTMVLVREGTTWRIRSWLERVDGPGIDDRR